MSVSLGILEKNPDGYGIESSITHEQNFKGQLVFITIEKDNIPGMRFTTTGDTLFIPSSFVVACCVLNANQGVFSVGNGFITSPGNVNAVTTEFLFEDATAKIRIFTPTQTNDSDLNGLWFTELIVENNDSTIINGLNIPAYNNGWNYEAFVNISGQRISLGKFSDPNKADNSNAYSGSERNAFTSFPGEDFLNNPPAGVTFPLDLSNALVSVSLSPVYSDTSINTPFEATLFEGTIPAGYNAGDLITLDPVLTSLPSGTLNIELDLYN